MNIESTLVIGKNPFGGEVAMGFDPKQLGINAVECLVWSLVATQESKQVFAFGEKGDLIYFNDDWFEATKSLPPHDQEERVNIGVVKIILSDRAIVIKTP